MQVGSALGVVAEGMVDIGQVAGGGPVTQRTGPGAAYSQPHRPS